MPIASLGDDPMTQSIANLILGIDHVGVCVAEMDQSGALWTELLGRPLADRQELQRLKTTAGFIRMADGQAAVELVCPMPGNAGLEKFLKQRGNALHHIAFAVSEIGDALAILGDRNVPLIDTTPRPGAGGHLVAFLHPAATGGVLVELVQRDIPVVTRPC